MEDLRTTDFPLEVPLPPSLSLDRSQREEVREWVLTVSMDQRVDQGLPLDQQGIYIGSLSSHADPSTSSLSECALTGYPIRGPTVQFDGSRKLASREDWNKFVTIARQSSSDSALNDVITFIQDWCGSAPNYAF
jgi:intraflagellar transport protein 172